MRARDLDAAHLDPTRFDDPRDVVADSGLSLGAKIRLLGQWAEDEEALLVAADEGMAGGETPRLAEVLRALRDLLEPGGA